MFFFFINKYFSCIIYILQKVMSRCLITVSDFQVLNSLQFELKKKNECTYLFLQRKTQYLQTFFDGKNLHCYTPMSKITSLRSILDFRVRSIVFHIRSFMIVFIITLLQCRRCRLKKNTILFVRNLEIESTVDSHFTKLFYDILTCYIGIHRYQ